MKTATGLASLGGLTSAKSLKLLQTLSLALLCSTEAAQAVSVPTETVQLQQNSETTGKKSESAPLQAQQQLQQQQEQKDQQTDPMQAFLIQEQLNQEQLLEQSQLLNSSQNPQLSHFKLGQISSELADLLRQYVPELSDASEGSVLTPGVLRKIRNSIISLLSTEGYFSARVLFERSPDATHVIFLNIVPGQRSIIDALDLTFAGAITQELVATTRDRNSAANIENSNNKSNLQRRNSILENWSLPKDAPFRDAQWGKAKNEILEDLHADTYLAAEITQSQALVDADAHTASLSLEVDSGPAFYIGEMKINGLQRYSPWLLERFGPPLKGSLYQQKNLLEFQRNLQNSAYFSTVSVNLDASPEQASQAALEVNLVERQARDLSFGAGYSSDTGLRTELSYRDRNLLERAWDLRSALSIEQKRQLAYFDVYLPPFETSQLDSFGVLRENSDIAGLITKRSAIGYKRALTHGKIEQRQGINFSHAEKQLTGKVAETSKALVATLGWTWRDIDDNFSPRDGQIAQIDLALAGKALASDQNFTRYFAKYQRWIPVAQHDSVLLRVETGQLFSSAKHGIPEDYLFRTGGSSTVRGYAYQSLGVLDATDVTGAVAGGRVTASASVEYDHWFDGNFGVAVFADVGDAAASWKDYKVKQSLGSGIRYMTPAGPIALDLAYARQKKSVRLEFSIAIAF